MHVRLVCWGCAGTKAHVLRVQSDLGRCESNGWSGWVGSVNSTVVGVAVTAAVSGTTTVWSYSSSSSSSSSTTDSEWNFASCAFGTLMSLGDVASTLVVGGFD
jgi:hypothetical protein